MRRFLSALGRLCANFIAICLHPQFGDEVHRGWIWTWRIAWSLAIAGIVLALLSLLHFGSWAAWILVTFFIMLLFGIGVAAHPVLMSAHATLWRVAPVDDHSEIAGHFYAVIGVIYAVLLAFVVVTAWQQFDHAEEMSMQESQSAVDLSESIRAFGTAQPRIDGLLSQYAVAMIGEAIQMKRDEPLCAQAGVTNKGDRACGDVLLTSKRAWPASAAANNTLAALGPALFGLSVNSLRNQTLYERAIAAYDELVAARDHRRRHYEEHLPGEMWLAFTIGGLIMLILPYMGQGDRNWARQGIRTAVLCIMVGMVVGLTYVFNHPFRATDHVVHRWCDVLRDFNRESVQNTLPHGTC